MINVSINGLKQIGIVCLAVSIFTLPTFATDPTPNIAGDASNATCNNGTLETYNGTSNLTANWTPNTIQLTWYADSESTTPLTGEGVPTSCVYGGGLTPPSPLEREGYTFRGWRVRPKQTCGIRGLNTSTPSSGGQGYQDASGGGVSQSTYGLSTNNTWAAEFSYGVVYGRALCSSTPGDNHDFGWGGNSEDWLKTPANTGGGNCWCQVTGFTPTPGPYTSGPTCTVSPAPSRWVFYYDFVSSGNCASYCAFYCEYYVRAYAAEFRSAIYGAVGQ